jgi:hypothetical protein
LVIDYFEDGDDLGNALEASSTVPLLTRLGVFSSYKGKTTIDGGITAVIPYKYENSKKIFINVSPKFTRQWPMFRGEAKNC